MSAAPLPEQQLAEIRAREAAARPGPWQAHHTPEGQLRGPSTVTDRDGRTVAVGVEHRLADFAVAARTDMPALLAEVERLETERHTTNAELDSAVKVIVELHELINSSGAAPAGGGK